MKTSPSGALVIKTIRLIDGCKTFEQFKVAKKYANLAIKALGLDKTQLNMPSDDFEILMAIIECYMAKGRELNSSFLQDSSNGLKSNVLH